MNDEKDFDKAIEGMEVPQPVELDESDFGLTEERDSRQLFRYAREYKGIWAEYASSYMQPSLDGYNALPRNYCADYGNTWDNPFQEATERNDVRHRDGENQTYHVRPEVINIIRDCDWIYDFNGPAVPVYYSPATVRFAVHCPSCRGTNEITVAQDILLRNPDPHVTCVCGAELIIEGQW